jgi:hypothetical protein
LLSKWKEKDGYSNDGEWVNMAKPGRKTKLTPEFIEEASKLIAGGNTVKDVAAYMGVGESAWYDWLSIGEQRKGTLYSEFAESIKKSKPVAKIAMLSIVTNAARDGNWQAACWYLERTDPDNYGRRDRIKQEITGKDGGPIQVAKAPNLSKFTDEELEAYAKLCERLDDSGSGDGKEVPTGDAG